MSRINARLDFTGAASSFTTRIPFVHADFLPHRVGNKASGPER
jgi:hypothetical protein